MGVNTKDMLERLFKYLRNPAALLMASYGFVPEYNSSNTQKCLKELFLSINDITKIINMTIFDEFF